MTGERRASYLLVAPALLLLAVFALLPIALTVGTSFRVDTPFAQRFAGLDNYRELLGDGAAWEAAGFTLVFVATSVLLELLVGLALALLMDGVLQGRGLVRAALLVPWAIPAVVAGVVAKLVLHDQYGLLNLALFGGDVGHYRAWLAWPGSARAAIVLADVWKTSGFAALLLLAGLQSIPREIHEAARADGAGVLRRFLSVTLPLLRPALLVALLFRTMDAFRVFDLVYVLTYGGPASATTVLQFYGYQRMFPEQRFGYGSAVAVLVFVLVGAVSLGLVRAMSRRVAAS